MKYDFTETGLDGSKSLCRTDEDGKIWWIPQDEANSDYQQYLRWLEDPNADEFQPPLS